MKEVLVLCFRQVKPGSSLCQERYHIKRKLFTRLFITGPRVSLDSRICIHQVVAANGRRQERPDVSKTIRELNRVKLTHSQTWSQHALWLHLADL